MIKAESVAGVERERERELLLINNKAKKFSFIKCV